MGAANLAGLAACIGYLWAYERREKRRLAAELADLARYARARPITPPLLRKEG